jgi:alpha-mannosidase
MSDIEKQVQEWRRGVMEKPRRGITRAEYIQQFLELIRPRIHPVTVDLAPWKVRHARYLGPARYQWVDPQWQPIKAGDTWGGEGLTGFFRTTFTVPEAFAGQPLMLDLFLGGDGMVRINGQPYAGLECFHREIILTQRAEAGQRYKLELEICVDHQVTPGPVHTFQYARAVTIDHEIEDFFWDFQAAFLAAGNEWARPDTAAYLLAALESSMLLCDPYAETEHLFRKSLRAAKAYLKTQLAAAPQNAEGELAILGHSHIDPVYLWDYGEFQRKILRTHTTQLMLMQEYPDWLFSQSQAIIYREMRDLYPEVYEQMKKRIREGRWEPLGGMFVEPDCNLISGESMVRQFLFGQRFFKNEFGSICRVGWLPDVFGMPQSMPMIMKGCGVDYFYTAKLVWNDTNEWKTHLFWWESPDGSRVLTHTPPLHFIGTNDAPHVMKYWKMLAPKKHVQKGLYTYGWGDGGGGVERRMLHVAARYKNMPGVPALKHQSALSYFEEQEQGLTSSLPRWKSEMYLETHRGTYTTAALLKKYNRRCERMLRELEILSSIAVLQGGTYEQSEINGAWKTVLINQFHDILPGSHIPKGFTDAVADYEATFERLARIRKKVGATLGGKNTTRSTIWQVFNSLLWPRTSTLHIHAPGMQAVDQDGHPLPSQTVEDEEGNATLLIKTPFIEACGAAIIRLTPACEGTPMAEELSVTTQSMENKHLRVALDTNGEITSLLDKRSGREFVAPGETANAFQLFEDNPGKYDAWDIARVYEKRRWDIRKADRVEVVEEGPLRVAIEITKHFSKSCIRQRLYLEAGAAWLDVRIWIDWQEDYRLLKLAFPLDVNAPHATYHIPYGFIERSTGDGSRWDQAKFEAPAQMWADLSEPTHGFSLINDCKYGYDIRGRVMRLTLLKAPKYPNPHADRHRHSLNIRLFPHEGGWRDAGVWSLAQDFNTPPTPIASSAKAPVIPSMLQWRGSSVVELEAWKMAEDSTHFVVRIRETYGQPAAGKLQFGFPVRSVHVANMLEEPGDALPHTLDAVPLRLHAHHALTLVIAPKS